MFGVQRSARKRVASFHPPPPATCERLFSASLSAIPAVCSFCFNNCCPCSFVRCACRTQLRYEREREEEAANPNRKKNKKPRRKSPPPELEEESGDEEVVWTERGMEDYEASDHFKRRSKMKNSGRGVSLSAEACAALPSLDKFMLT